MLDKRRPRHRVGFFTALPASLFGMWATHAVALPDAPPHAAYEQQLASARANYFAGIDGNSDASDRAQDAFASLERDHPNDPTVLAYSGSLELMEAARTWSVWNKHKLATEGLAKLDRSLELAPDNLEVRFIHGETSWHLPFFYHRKDQAERDFAYIAPRAESAARQGALPAPLAAAALDRYGRILEDRDDSHGAESAYRAAVRVAGNSPGGRDASHRLQ